MRTIIRRVSSIGSVVAVLVLLTMTSPLWVPLSLFVGLVRQRRFVVTRILLFGLVYAAMECVGVLLAFAAWVRWSRDEARFVDANYAIQRWWAGTLFGAVRRILGLRFEVGGRDALEAGPFLLLMRHASIIDTLLPAALVANEHDVRLRYVLKRELLADPCLDIVGLRLPNHFVDRAHASDADREALAALASDLGPGDGVVIYPEGTYFTVPKRDRVLARLRDRGSPHLARAEALRQTLPPRLGGVSALLDGAPDVDVVICAHEGLDHFARLANIASGEVVGATVQVHFWRVSAGDVPLDEEGRASWLYREWARVDERARAATHRARAAAARSAPTDGGPLPRGGSA